MASPQCHVLVWYLRWRLKRPVTEPIDIAGARRSLGKVRTVRVPHGMRIEPMAGAPVPGEWVAARKTPPDAPVLLYLHGGGFFACSPATHRPATLRLARPGRLRVLVPEYRLAPEHRFPSAVDDAVACCDWIERHTGRPVAALAGDSAGGNLVLATLLRLRDSGRRLPTAAVAFSPVTDLAATGASVVSNDRRDAMFFGASLAKLAAIYLPAGVAPTEPLASPLYADLSGLPPLLLHVGRDEVLRDDSTRLAERAREHGVDVRVKLWPVVPHAWQVMSAVVPEGRASLREAERFLASKAGA